MTSQSRFLVEKIIVAKLVNEFPVFYGTQISFPCSREHVNGRCPEPDESILIYPSFYVSVFQEVSYLQIIVFNISFFTILFNNKEF
jgi:hypothetical protein